MNAGLVERTFWESIGAGDGEMGCFVALPDVDEPRAAVVVLQEIFGVNAEIQRIAALLADSGYVAAAPDLFYRTSPRFNAPYSSEGAELGYAAAAAVSTANVLRDLGALVTWLDGQPYVRSGRIGTWGFCMGGAVSFLAATLPGVACAASFYGVQIARPWRSGEPGALRLVDEIRAPLLLVFGGRDDRTPPEAIAGVERTLTAAGKRCEIKVYPQSGHGFFRKAGSDRNADDVADAWQLARRFFERELA